MEKEVIVYLQGFKSDFGVKNYNKTVPQLQLKTISNQQPAIRHLQAATHARAAPKLAGRVVVYIKAHPIPSGGAVGPIDTDNDVDSEGGGDRTGAEGAGRDVVEEDFLSKFAPFFEQFGRNGAILGEICIISPPPSLPSSSALRMLAAHLGRLDYNQSGTLGVWMALTMVAKNDNRAATAGFLDVGFTLSFHRINVTLLRAAPFAVPRNGLWPLQYDVQAVPVSLNGDAMQAMDAMKEEDEEEKDKRLQVNFNSATLILFFLFLWFLASHGRGPPLAATVRGGAEGRAEPDTAGRSGVGGPCASAAIEGPIGRLLEAEHGREGRVPESGAELEQP
uniref:Uncharacterized protein n=1 Tax=Ananas comosus var. bracteatus TaxID=296719 RepID=A0A6V7NJB7_ANACO|nr:unnamed protein product [Ananas comosus var. bracteatus]